MIQLVITLSKFITKEIATKAEALLALATLGDVP
jgi:hypothetical protein